MKNIMITTVISITVIIAIKYIKKIKIHTKAVNQLCIMVENIEILLTQNNINVEEILKTLTLNNNFYLLTFINHINENMKYDKNISSKANISHINKNKIFNSEEKEIIINFFSLLGKSDLNGQLIHCKTYKDIFKKMLNENELRESIDCKNSSILIFGIGFLIVILII